MAPPPGIEVPLARPPVTEAVKDLVRRTLESGWITEGPVTKAFEAAFAAFIGCRAAIAVTSCTVGLDVALRAAGVGPGDEVIVPDFTYPCTASVVALVGAVPVIVDIDRDTMLVDCNRMEAAVTSKTKAIIPVSLFGNPLDYERLDAFRARHGVTIIEDAACSVGSRYAGAFVGNHADLTVFSLHPRKILTIGEGGFITTGDAALEAWIRSYKNFGVTERDGVYTFDILGHNYRVSDILSAVGLAMMDDLPGLIEHRRSLARAYTERLEGVPGVRLPALTPRGEHGWQSYPVFVDDRDRRIGQMRARGIEVQVGTHALHRHPAFGDERVCRLEGPFENSGFCYEHCMVLPIHHEMTEDTVGRVVGELQAIL